MKNCTSCGYRNPDPGLKCGVCGRDIAALPFKSEPVSREKKRQPAMLLISGLLLLACGAVFFFTGNFPPKNEAEAGSRETDGDGERTFGYEGVLYGLDKMSGLRFLPEAEKRRVLPLLSSPDDRVAYAAAKTIGSWLRAETEASLARGWFDSLLAASSSGRPVVRRQAALEAGQAAALGFPAASCLEQVRQAAAGLAAQKEPELKGAGFFLSSMAGMLDLTGPMRETLLSDPSPAAKLYAACALSRLSRSEGYEYLSQAVAGNDPDLKTEALSCLSYSSSSEAERLLVSAAHGGFGPASAEAAKRGLILRGQLAIIKK